MMTKRQLCLAMIRKEFGTTLPDEHLAYRSSTGAIAMEYLGMLKTRAVKDYVEARGGTVFVDFDEEHGEPCHLSFRELLDLLPSENTKQSWMDIQIQVNGKLSDDMQVSIYANEEEIMSIAENAPGVRQLIDGRSIKKRIYVPKKLVNFVV